MPTIARPAHCLANLLCARANWLWIVLGFDFSFFFLLSVFLLLQYKMHFWSFRWTLIENNKPMIHYFSPLFHISNGIDLPIHVFINLRSELNSETNNYYLQQTLNALCARNRKSSTLTVAARTFWEQKEKNRTFFSVASLHSYTELKHFSQIVTH